jgi:hypothetical protein
MIEQLRIYTINEGMMDSWSQLFASKLQPLLAENGIKVPSRWIDDSGSKFIWLKTFEGSETELKVHEKGFFESSWWLANVDTVRSHIAHQEVILLNAV